MKVPPGWNVTPSGDDIYFQSGRSYAMVRIVRGGQVAEVTEQIGRQWTNFRRLQAGSTQVAGQNGTFAVFAGATAKGGDSLLKALSASFGQDALVLVFGAPVAEWNTKKADFEQLEKSLRLGRPASPEPGTQGFHIVSRAGRVGQALQAPIANGGSARRAFRGAFQMTMPYFDAQPRILGAFGDAGDQEVQAFFRANQRGVPVKGWMSVGGGQVVVAFDEEAQFGRSFPQLVQALGGGSGTAPAPGKPPPSVQLQRQTFVDGSGSIGLAPGWRIGSSWKGIVDIGGPHGELAVFGYYQQVLSNWMGPAPNIPGFITGPIRDPASALRSYYDSLAKGAISRGQARFRVIEGTQVEPLVTGGRTALMLVEVETPQMGLALVSVSPVGDGWMFYTSQVAAPAQEFARQLPVMMQMWGSWSLNPALLQERMRNAMQSMRETHAILQGINANTQTAMSRSNLAWSQVIRGVSTIEDTSTRTRGDVDTNYAQRIVQDLNEQGYSYRIVPYQELIP